MTDSELRRRLIIGFMTSLRPEKRLSMIKEGLPVEDVCRMFKIKNPDFSAADKVLSYLNEKESFGIWWYGEEGFPPLFELEKSFPLMLFYEGTKPDKSDKRVTIVGSRRADYLGVQKSFMLGLEAAINGLRVVTGVAEGCDQAACAGSISAYPLHDTLYAAPILVLPNGFDIEYPRGSAYFRNRTLERGGTIISCFIPGTPALKYNFVFRNMILAALSEMTLVIQSPAQSGALMTAELALRIGRDVCVSVGGLGNSFCRQGTCHLANDGAMVINSYSDYGENGIDSMYTIRQVNHREEHQVRFGDRFYNIRRKG
ncbi:MAG: DNA-protecting protein DprA [Sphaerochaetaceae bacterium]|nr:DNA-protecting protein DprA [Sphaerochaetaceae bacterium]